MNMQINLSDNINMLKNEAKDHLAGKYHTVVMTFLFYLMLVLLFARFSNSLTGQICSTLMRLFSISGDHLLILGLSYFVPFTISVSENIIHIGICLFFLNIACHHNYNTFDLLYGYSNQFGKNFCLSGIMTFLSFVTFLPVELMLERHQNNALFPEDGLKLLLLQLCTLIIYLVIYLSISQIYYISLDHPELSVKEILKQSAKLMKGHKLRLFLLDLSFLPLLLLAVPTLGIGLFWIIPYMNMVHSLFFLKLMHVDTDSPELMEANP